MALLLDRPARRAPGAARIAIPAATRVAVAGGVAVAGALLAAAALLWARHGATVFFDVMSAGIASCL